MDEWIKKFVGYIHNGILFSHKKGEILPFVTRNNLEGIVLSEIGQTERHILYELSYIWNLKKQTKRNSKEKNIRFLVTRSRAWSIRELLKVFKSYKLPVIR